MKKVYDCIVVGSGLTGATIAYLAKQQGMRCLVLERRSQTAGNVRDKKILGINVHLYGAHIFHTSDESIWQFVNMFATFNDYRHYVLARYEGKLYHLPFSYATFYDVYGASSPTQIHESLQKEHSQEFYACPQNLEEQAINLVGRPAYETLIKGYTEKQWGKSPKDLPSSIITRLPVRNSFECSYFDDKFQGIPMNGYSAMIGKMLDGIEVRTCIDFNTNREYWLSQTNHVFHSGMIDEFLDYEFGELEYRSLEFKTEELRICNFQGCAVVNELSRDIPYTRIIEHKHFSCNEDVLDLPHTIVTREYPLLWKQGEEAFYPVMDKRNTSLYQRYKDAARTLYPQVTFCGRLGDYRYYDMDEAIANALSLATQKRCKNS